jgi:hypothetical protein
MENAALTKTHDKERNDDKKELAPLRDQSAPVWERWQAEYEVPDNKVPQVDCRRNHAAKTSLRTAPLDLLQRINEALNIRIESVVGDFQSLPIDQRFQRFR